MLQTRVDPRLSLIKQSPHAAKTNLRITNLKLRDAGTLSYLSLEFSFVIENMSENII